MLTRCLTMLGCAVVVGSMPLMAAPGPPPERGQVAAKVAKLTAESSAKAPASGAVKTTALPATPSTAARPKQMAAVPPDLIASRAVPEVVDLGREYATFEDPGNARECFQQAASMAPGSRDAGWALVLMASAYASQDRFAEMQAVLDQVLHDYDQPDVRAFASLCGDVETLIADGQAQAAVQRCADTANAWRGTDLGAWASLYRAQTYQYTLHDPDAAQAAYQAVAKEYAGKTAGLEALLGCADGLIDTLTPPDDRLPLAYQYYQQVLDAQPPLSLQIRAQLGLLGGLLAAGRYSECYASASQMIADYPDHPGIPWCHAIRAQAGATLGDRSLVTADLRAFLDSDVAGSDPEQRHSAKLMLAEQACLAGQLDEAESAFAAEVEACAAEGYARGVSEASHAVAVCRADRGDYAGAMAYLLKAADAAPDRDHEALYLYGAARAAERIGDKAARGSIIARMVADVPGSYLTMRLVGHDVLPSPDI